MVAISTRVPGMVPMLMVAVLMLSCEVSGWTTKDIKVLRVRVYRDLNCTVPSSNSVNYATVDGSCLCYDVGPIWSEKSESCTASSGLVVGTRYNSTFSTSSNQCRRDKEGTFSLSGTLGVCEIQHDYTSYSTFADVTYTPISALYIWQMLAIGIGCFLATVIGISIAVTVYRKRQARLHEKYMQMESRVLPH